MDTDISELPLASKWRVIGYGNTVFQVVCNKFTGYSGGALLQSLAGYGEPYWDEFIPAEEGRLVPVEE